MKANKPFTLPTAFLLSVLTLFAVSCNTPENYEGEPNIYAMLSTELPRATVMLGYTASIEDTLKPDTVMDTFWYLDTFAVYPMIVFPWNGASGAEATLEHVNDTYNLTELSDSAGYYVSDSGLVFSPGEIWKLNVRYPDGQKFEARTRIVSSIEITSPLSETLHMTDTFKWASSGDARGYKYRVEAWGRFKEDTVEMLLQSSEGLYEVDKKTIPVDEMIYPYYGITIDSVTFQVAALDSNAFDYAIYDYKIWQDPTTNKDDYMHIKGAWGTFGSLSLTPKMSYIWGDTTSFPIPARCP